MSDDIQKKKEAEAQAKLDELQQQQRAALESLNQIELETETAKSELAKAVADKVTVEDGLYSLKQDLDNLTVTRSGKLAELDKLTDEIRVATADLESAKTAADKARADGVQTLSDTQVAQDKLVVDAQLKVDALTKKKETLENDIVPIAGQAARLQQQITDANARLVTLAAQITEAEATLSTLKGKQSVINDAVTQLQKQSDSLTAEIATKSAASKSLDDEISGKNTQIVDLDAQIKALEETLKVNNDQNVEFLKARAGLKAGQEEVDQRLAYLRSKYEDLGEPW